MTTLAALKALHEELGGPARLWFGVTAQNEWLLLDRSIEPNLPGMKPANLVFERFKDWSEVEIKRGEWDFMPSYGDKDFGPTIPPSVLSYLFKRLHDWQKTYEERALERKARQQKVLEEVYAKRQADEAREMLTRRAYSDRRRSDALTRLRHELKELQSAERMEIRVLLAERGVQHLVHFTSLKNLASILANGLLPRHTLQCHSMQFRQNDDIRQDGLPEATSLSVGFPNYLMMYRKRGTGPFGLLALNPNLLLELPCLFSPVNAASHGLGQHLGWLGPYIGVKALRRMFEGGVTVRQKYALPHSFTTDPQAEVLVVDAIPTTYIQGIVLPPFLSAEWRAVLLNQAGALGIADMSDGQRAWFESRPDFPARDPQHRFD